MCSKVSEKVVSNIIIIQKIYFIFHLQQKVLNAKNLNEEKTTNEGNCFLTDVGAQMDSAKTIENERRNGGDKKQRFAEKLRRSRVFLKKMLLEKEAEKLEEKNNMKKRIQIFEENSNNIFVPNVTEE